MFEEQIKVYNPQGFPTNNNMEGILNANSPTSILTQPHMASNVQLNVNNSPSWESDFFAKTHSNSSSASNNNNNNNNNTADKANGQHAIADNHTPRSGVLYGLDRPGDVSQQGFEDELTKLDSNGFLQQKDLSSIAIEDLLAKYHITMKQIYLIESSLLDLSSTTASRHHLKKTCLQLSTKLNIYGIAIKERTRADSDSLKYLIDIAAKNRFPQIPSSEPFKLSRVQNPTVTVESNTNQNGTNSIKGNDTILGSLPASNVDNGRQNGTQLVSVLSKDSSKVPIITQHAPSFPSALSRRTSQEVSTQETVTATPSLPDIQSITKLLTPITKGSIKQHEMSENLGRVIDDIAQLPTSAANTVLTKLFFVNNESQYNKVNDARYLTINLLMKKFGKSSDVFKYIKSSKSCMLRINNWLAFDSKLKNFNNIKLYLKFISLLDLTTSELKDFKLYQNLLQIKSKKNIVASSANIILSDARVKDGGVTDVSELEIIHKQVDSKASKDQSKPENSSSLVSAKKTQNSSVSSSAPTSNSKKAFSFNDYIKKLKTKGTTQPADAPRPTNTSAHVEESKVTKDGLISILKQKNFGRRSSKRVRFADGSKLLSVKLFTPEFSYVAKGGKSAKQMELSESRMMKRKAKDLENSCLEFDGVIPWRKPLKINFDIIEDMVLDNLSESRGGTAPMVSTENITIFNTSKRSSIDSSTPYEPEGLITPDNIYGPENYQIPEAQQPDSSVDNSENAHKANGEVTEDSLENQESATANVDVSLTNKNVDESVLALLDDSNDAEVGIDSENSVDDYSMQDIDNHSDSAAFDSTQNFIENAVQERVLPQEEASDATLTTFDSSLEQTRNATEPSEHILESSTLSRNKEIEPPAASHQAQKQSAPYSTFQPVQKQRSPSTATNDTEQDQTHPQPPTEKPEDERVSPSSPAPLNLKEAVSASSTSQHDLKHSSVSASKNDESFSDENVSNKRPFRNELEERSVKRTKSEDSFPQNELFPTKLALVESSLDHQNSAGLSGNRSASIGSHDGFHLKPTKSTVLPKHPRGFSLTPESSGIVPKVFNIKSGVLPAQPSHYIKIKGAANETSSSSSNLQKIADMRSRDVRGWVKNFPMDILDKYSYPCVYYNRSHCRNGNNCRYLHVRENDTGYRH